MNTKRKARAGNTGQQEKHNEQVNDHDNTIELDKGQAPGVRVVDVELATALGSDRQAMFLRQLQYWLERVDNYKDDKVWAYNSYEKWNEQFPFWSLHTTRRVINALEELGVIETGNYNKRPGDQTKWYTINYAKLVAISRSTVEKWQRRIKDQLSKMDKAGVQKGQTITIRLLQEITLALEVSCFDDLTRNRRIQICKQISKSPKLAIFKEQYILNAEDKQEALETYATKDKQIRVASAAPTATADQAAPVVAQDATLPPDFDQYGDAERVLDAVDLFFVQMLYYRRGNGKYPEWTPEHSRRAHNIISQFGGDWDGLSSCMTGAGESAAFYTTHQFLSYLEECARHSRQWWLDAEQIAPPPQAVAVLVGGPVEVM